MGTLHLIEGVSSLTGLAIYNLYLSRVSYRNILLYTMIGAFFVGLTVSACDSLHMYAAWLICTIKCFCSP